MIAAESDKGRIKDDRNIRGMRIPESEERASSSSQGIQSRRTPAH